MTFYMREQEIREEGLEEKAIEEYQKISQHLNTK